MNLIDGTKDFSGYWYNGEHWTNDGTYKGLTVKKDMAPVRGFIKFLQHQLTERTHFQHILKVQVEGKLLDVG